jgi:SAM-dependent methyltransferase
MTAESRTPAQLREHYEIEKELAAKLRNASRQERRTLYSEVYNELFQRVPAHPQLTRKSSDRDTQRIVAYQMQFLKRFLKPDATFLEVGPGDCALSIEVAKHVKKVYAVDVSDEITKGLSKPPNFQLILSDGCGIALPDNSVNVAYSHQLMEHLHPDDAFEQLQNIYNALAPGGVYICVTPNRLSGPHDISVYFDRLATGFHLKEYTIHELGDIFKKVGFSKVASYAVVRGLSTKFPRFALLMLESFLDAIPYAFSVKLARCLPCRILLGIRLVGSKSL